MISNFRIWDLYFWIRINFPDLNLNVITERTSKFSEKKKNEFLASFVKKSHRLVLYNRHIPAHTSVGWLIASNTISSRRSFDLFHTEHTHVCTRTKSRTRAVIVNSKCVSPLGQSRFLLLTHTLYIDQRRQR